MSKVVVQELKDLDNQLKKSIKNIKDLDHDYSNDNLEIRGADGELTKNPSKDDIEQALGELEEMKSKVENKLKKLEKTKTKSIGRSR